MCNIFRLNFVKQLKPDIMIPAVRKNLKIAAVAFLLLGTAFTFGILHSLSNDLQPAESENIFVEEVHDKDVLKDVQLIKRLMQKAAEFVSFSMPV